jgi:hypothetical protein
MTTPIRGFLVPNSKMRTSAIDPKRTFAAAQKSQILFCTSLANSGFVVGGEVQPSGQGIRRVCTTRTTRYGKPAGFCGGEREIPNQANIFRCLPTIG